MAQKRSELEDAVDRLYQAPYEAFTETRDQLAREAKAAGKADLAAALKKERRPPVTVWALNVFARRAPEQVQALLESGEQLRHAQREAVQGGGSEALRDAAAAQRALLGELSQAAAALLKEAGAAGSTDQLDRISGTLLAAANGAEEHGQLLRHGRLERDLPRPGFGDFAGLDPSAAAFAAPPPPPPRSPPKLKVVPREEDEEERRLREAEEARERERRSQQARQQAQQRVQDAQREVARLGGDVEQARQAVQVAEAAHLEAVERARRARDERNAAEAALARAERELREAELEEAKLR